MWGVLNIFGQLILYVLHLLFAIYLKVKLLKPLYNKISYIIALQFYKENRFSVESKVIEKAAKTFPKIPKHMVLALGEEGVYYDDLIQLIVWALPAGVPVLSFYDHKNEIQPEVLQRLFAEKHKNLMPYIKWGVSFAKSKAEISGTETGMSNGSARPRLQVNILLSKHGRQLLIDCVKELAADPEVEIQDRKTAESAIDNLMMKKLESSPDPDLMVICGDYYTTYGLSPWHVGFTEFALIPSYRLLTPSDFVRVLKVYAYCEQKFGT